jgi:hypothetical protein
MENNLVRKSNYLIEASYKLSLVEQRLIMVLASMIKASDAEFKKYPLAIKDFATLLELKNRDEYSHLKGITKRLLTRAFSMKLPDALLQIGWLSSAKYLEGKGVVELCFDPELKPYLLQLKERFTSYKLKNVIQLKSSFSIRIYELLKQYEKVGERTFLLEKLRELLGIEPTQYKLYGDFKRKVILVAQHELGEKTDISFEYEEIKIGRSVGKIRFIMHTQHPVSRQAVQPELPIQAMIPDLTTENQADADLEKLEILLPPEYRGKESFRKLLAHFLEAHDFNYVARNIEYANTGSNAVNPGASLGKGSNYRSYLTKALRGDYGLAFQEDRETSQAGAEKERQEREAAEATARRTQEANQREQENKERARVYRHSLPPEALEALREEALARLDPTHRDLVARKAPGSEITLKLVMDKICLERMKLA